MTRYEAVKNRILAGSDMDYFGVCPAAALDGEPAGRRPVDLLPNARSIIVFGRRLISGAIQTKFRIIENDQGGVLGSYSSHNVVLSVNHLCMKETYDIAQYLENTYGCFAMPLTNNILQAIQPEGNFVPFFADPYQSGMPVDIYKAAVAAGIGEMGWNHHVLTPDNGPRVYLCAIVTSLEFERYDSPYTGEKLCDPEKCGVCAKVCPVEALSATEAKEWNVGAHTGCVGALDVNACAAACFGFHKALNGRTGVVVSTKHPSDAELAEALEKQYEKPGYQTLDHVPTFHCDRCMVYCPVGNWNEQFRDRSLTKGGENL